MVRKHRAMRNKTTSTGEYLAFLSAKHEVDPDQLFQALVTAEDKIKSQCKDLTIERRGYTRDKVTFLILKNLEVVAQFSVHTEFLLREDHPIRNFMRTEKVQRFLFKKTKRSSFVPIKDLRTGMNQVNLKAKVLEIPEPRQVFTRYGDPASVANALIEDQTGTIRLCLWNEQIGSLSAGDSIQIENARTSTFRGQRQISLGRKSLLSIEQPCTTRAV